MKGWLIRVFLLAALAGIARCGTTSIPPAPAPAPSPAPQVATAEVGGLWTGQMRVTPCDVGSVRCNAVNNIRFVLSQYGSQLTGSYACAAGNMSCRHGGADDSGKIVAGSVSGNQVNLAVRLPADLSDCYYSGTVTSPMQANGNYVCYRGGRMIEEGVWSALRQSPE